MTSSSIPPGREHIERMIAQARAKDVPQVKALLAMAPKEAARWLAKWLIRTDVERGYSEHQIQEGGQGYMGSLGDVDVWSGRKIRVRRIGPAASWTDYPTGYEYA